MKALKKMFGTYQEIKSNKNKDFSSRQAHKQIYSK
jgi:hypothetical protein